MRAAHAACPGRTRTKKRPTKPATRKPSDLDKKLYRSPNATLSACRRSSTDHRAVCKYSNVLTCVGQAKNDLLLWRLAVRLDILWTRRPTSLAWATISANHPGSLATKTDSPVLGAREVYL